MGAEKVVRYKNIETPRQAGEVGRIRVLKGPDQGAIFVVKNASVTIGRGEDVDLMIRDVKASRTHARLDYTREGWVMSDLGSANGIFFQGEYIRKFPLKSGDHFTVGETIFEFLVSQEPTLMLVAPLRDAKEVEKEDQALSKQKIRVQKMAKPVKGTSSSTAKKSNPRTLVLLALGAGLYFYMDQQEAPTQKKPAKKVEVKVDEKELASYLPSEVSKDVEKTADQYYWQGFREYINGNYLRAKDSFELALQVNPGHEKARHYLASAEKENNDEIRRLIAAGNKAKDVGRNSEAKGYFETAMRHLYTDRSNPDYIECEEALKELKKRGNP